MRVVIAPDSFSGSLSAMAACAAMVAGWRAAAPDDEITGVPLSDGGPGFVAVLHAALGGEQVTVTVADPLERPVAATYLRVGDVAYVESAQACGLHLLDPAERDPTRTTTRGVGQLLAHAVDAGAKRLVVGLGGSATNDGGAGLAAALGGLPAAAAALAPVELVAATDVDSPLLGPSGASAVYGPQKGATDEQVQELDRRLADWATELAAVAGRDVAPEPGAGAAGGLGAALLALGASRVSGIGVVMDAVGLRDLVGTADLVVTGEGSFDHQSLRGKVVTGVAALALQAAVPCLVLAGKVQVGRQEMAAAGVEAAYDLVSVAGSERVAAEQASATLIELARGVAERWSVRR
ncbi:MAG: glycerate kinase [Frankiaceae bacterium]